MKVIKISASRFESPHIEKMCLIETESNIFKIEYIAPIIETKLVMVDEYSLRIDYTLEHNRKHTAFVRDFNRSLLKLEVWNKKEVEIGNGYRLYDFNLK